MVPSTRAGLWATSEDQLLLSTAGLGTGIPCPVLVPHECLLLGQTLPPGGCCSPTEGWQPCAGPQCQGWTLVRGVALGERSCGEETNWTLPV